MEYINEFHKAWIDFNNYPVIYLDKGGENEVFYDGAATIYKQ